MSASPREPAPSPDVTVAEFAARLDQLRKHAGLSLSQLADLTHYHKTSLSRAAKGERLPAWPLVEQYVQHCDGDVSAFKALWQQAKKNSTALRQPPPVPPIPVPPPGRPPADDQAEVARPHPGREQVRPGSGRPVLWRRRKRLVGAGAAATVLLIMAVTFVIIDPFEEGPGADPLPAELARCSEPTAQLRVVASPEKVAVLQQLAATYGPRRSTDGTCHGVSVTEGNSGAVMKKLADGWSESEGDPPDVWNPASQVWLTLARTASAKAAQLLPAEAAGYIAKTPLVIAMPKPMAEALRWPRQDVDWKLLTKFSTDPAAWAQYTKKPQWGPFRLGKTNPEFSTSGLNATVASVLAATGKTTFDDKDLDNPKVQDFVRRIERSVVHYGPTTLTFLQNLRQADDQGRALSYISAVTVEESSVVAYNLGYPCGSSSCEKKDPPTTKLVAFYPPDGTMTSDHPYIPLTDLNDAKKAIAAGFLTHLHSPAASVTLGGQGFRDHAGKAPATINHDNGTLPEITPPPINPAGGPALKALLATWPRLRKPANVLFVLDTSGSMDDDIPGTGKRKIDILIKQRRLLTSGFTDTDRVGLWTFSEFLDGGEHHQSLVPMGSMGQRLKGKNRTRRQQIEVEIQGMTPKIGTALYDTAYNAVTQVNKTFDPNAINAVVLLTDGRDQTDHGTIKAIDDLRLKLQAQAKIRTDRSEEPVRVFTVGYGSSADERDAKGVTVLDKIAAETGAARYAAKDNTTSITDVLTDVISNF